MSRISLPEMAKILNVSSHTVLNIKRQLGYKKNTYLYTEDIEKFRHCIKPITRKGGRTNPNFPKYYKKSLRILEKQGYITYADLMRIFKVSHITHVEAYFESQNNFIYDEVMEIDNKKVKVYKLNKNIWDEWRADARIRPPKNGPICVKSKNA